MRLNYIFFFALLLLIISSCELLNEQAAPEETTSNELTEEDLNTPLNGFDSTMVIIAVSDNVNLNENSYYIPDEDSLAITASSVGTVTMTAEYGAFEVGDVINAAPTAAAPNGLLRKIIGKESKGPLVTYTTESAAINDYFKELSIQESIPLFQNYSSGRVLTDYRFNINTTIDEFFTVSGALTFRDPVVDLNFDISNGNINDISFLINGKILASIGCSAPADLLDFEFNEDLFNLDISKLVIAVTGLTGKIATMVITPKMIISMNLKGSIGDPLYAEVEGSMDVNWQGAYSTVGGFTTDLSVSNEQFGFDYQLTPFNKLEYTFSLDAGTRLCLFDEKNSFTLGTQIGLENFLYPQNNPSINSNIYLSTIKDIKITDKLVGEFIKSENYGEELYRKDSLKVSGYKYLNIIDGNYQVWNQQDTLETPLKVKVVNQNGGRVEDVKVIFNNKNFLNGYTENVVYTDAQGYASTYWLPITREDTIVVTLEYEQSPSLEKRNTQKFYLNPENIAFPTCYRKDGTSIDYNWSSETFVSSPNGFQDNLRGEIKADSISWSYGYSSGLNYNLVWYKTRIQGDQLIGVRQECKTFNEYGTTCSGTLSEVNVSFTKVQCP